MWQLPPPRARLGIAAAAVLGILGVVLPLRAQPDCPPAVPSGQVRLALEPRAENALVLDATVELDAAAEVYVEYGAVEGGWLRTPARAAAASHRLPLVRLHAATTYRARAFALDQAGCPALVASADATTGPLPSELQPIQVQSSGEPSFPLTLMDLRPPRDAAPWLAILDARGRPVWYYKTYTGPPGASFGAVHATIRLASGNWLYLISDFGVEEITPDGRLVRRIQFHDKPAAGIHHELYQRPDGRVLFFGAEDRRVDDTVNGGPRDLLVRGDVLLSLDLLTEQVEQLWSIWDTHDPTQRLPEWHFVEQGAEDWSHANSIALGPHGNLILSFRRLNQVISLAPDSRTVEWRLGGPGSTFSFPDPDDQFHGQHAASQLPNGNLLLFDNGNYRPDDEYSRALELALDLQAMTARKAWEYRHQPPIFSDRISNALRLPNGNTLVNFGAREDPSSPVVLVEARPDGSSAWVQRLSFAGRRTGRYRAYPLESIAGELPVEPTPVR